MVTMLIEVQSVRPLSEATHLYKTNECIYGRDNDEGWLREVELRGGFLAVSSLHCQQTDEKQNNNNTKIASGLNGHPWYKNTLMAIEKSKMNDC
jgi:hypothetical protein